VESIWVRRAIVAIALALAVGAGLQWIGLLGRDGRTPVVHPGMVDERPTPSAADCIRDPAGLPSPSTASAGQAVDYLHGCGSRLYDSQGHEVRITGVNWNGMETGDYVPGGLGNRRWQELLDLVASLGYNTIRLPFSNEALEPGRRVNNADFTLNPDLQGKSPLEVMDLLIAGARERGLRVILDRHVPSPNSRPGLWYSREVPEERWISDWRMLAARYRGNDTVIGVDLSNEPQGAATWGSGDTSTDWRLASERAGNAVLEENPYLLVFVEGIESYNGSHSWWGGNLEGVRTDPVRLRVPNRVVYSPHDYGPAISDQPWFQDPLFPGNMPAVWDRQWGYIQREGIAPVVVGEFGGRSVGDDKEGQWQKVLLGYLRSNGIGAMVWSLNPNWDTGGLVGPDWETVDAQKQVVYSQVLAPPLAVGAGGAFGEAPTHLKLQFRQESVADPSTEVSFSFAIWNDGPNTLDLSRFEVRYWLNPTSPSDSSPFGSSPQVKLQSKTIHDGLVLADFVDVNQGGHARYLRLRYDTRAGAVGHYQGGDIVTVSFSSSGWPNHVPTADYSYMGTPRPDQKMSDWDRATLYLDGKLVWGREP
jgi:endoglucanase